MFSLAYKIKDDLEIDNEKIYVNMAFDKVLRFIDAMNDDELSDLIKIEVGLKILIGEVLDWDFEKRYRVFNEIQSSFFEAEKAELKTDIMGNPLPQKAVKELDVYSLVHDAEYIYSSFMQAYGIDLFEQQGKLHWLKFKALLNGLPEDTKFRQVVNIRVRKLPTGKGSAEERKQLQELKEIYALPQKDGEKHDWE